MMLWASNLYSGVGQPTLNETGVGENKTEVSLIEEIPSVDCS